MIQKVLRIDDRRTARETYEDEMRRYNPGGGFEQSNMRKVIERARSEKNGAQSGNSGGLRFEHGRGSRRGA